MDNENQDNNLSESTDLSEIVNESDDRGAMETPLDNVSLDRLLSNEAKTRSPTDVKKARQIGLGLLGTLLVIILLSIYGCQPKKASMAYGVCATFLELNTPYPHTLKHTWLEGSRTAVRIYFTSTDPFGQFKQEMMECKFGPDEKMGMRVTEVLRNRRPVEDKAVEAFNLTLPAVMASNPYLVMPGPNWKNPLLKD